MANLRLYGWLPVISRIIVALVGGYAFAYFAAAALAVMLPGPRSESATIAMLTGLLFYAAAIMWVFSVRTSGRAWLGLAVSTSICAGIAYLPAITA